MKMLTWVSAVVAAVIICCTGFIFADNCSTDPDDPGFEIWDGPYPEYWTVEFVPCGIGKTFTVTQEFTIVCEGDYSAKCVLTDDSCNGHIVQTYEGDFFAGENYLYHCGINVFDNDSNIRIRAIFQFQTSQHAEIVTWYTPWSEESNNCQYLEYEGHVAGVINPTYMKVDIQVDLESGSSVEVYADKVDVCESWE